MTGCAGSPTRLPIARHPVGCTGLLRRLHRTPVPGHRPCLALLRPGRSWLCLLSGAVAADNGLSFSHTRTSLSSKISGVVHGHFCRPRPPRRRRAPASERERIAREQQPALTTVLDVDNAFERDLVGWRSTGASNTSDPGTQTWTGRPLKRSSPLFRRWSMS